jgi:hypothetical protein
MHVEALVEDIVVRVIVCCRMVARPWAPCCCIVAPLVGASVVVLEVGPSLSLAWTRRE